MSATPKTDIKQVNLTTGPGNPVVTCRVNNKYAFVELRSSEECTKALNLNGIPFMGQVREGEGLPSTCAARSTGLSLSRALFFWCACRDKAVFSRGFVGVQSTAVAFAYTLGCPPRARRALRCPAQILAMNIAQY